MGAESRHLLLCRLQRRFEPQRLQPLHRPTGAGLPAQRADLLHQDVLLVQEELLSFNLVRRTFMLELPLSSLFESPTVAASAAHISESLLEQEDAEELERMIAEIENLSLTDLDAGIVDAMR